MRLSGMVAIVTGGAGGMGRHHCLALSREGADITVVDVVRSEPAVVQEVIATGQRALWIRCDVTNESEVKDMVRSTYKHFGRIDILCNNAGVAGWSPLVQLSVEEWQQVIDVNLKGVFLCCKHVIPYMAKQRTGKIINIASVAALQGAPMMAHYSAAKFGVIGLTQTLAMELAHYSINVNAVAPRAVVTPMLRKVAELVSPGEEPDDVMERLSSDNYFRRPITASEVAQVVTWLASDDARSITAQVICVTGGAEKKLPGPEPYFSLEDLEGLTRGGGD